MTETSNENTVTLEFSDEAMREINRLATTSGVSIRDLIHRALSMEKFLIEETRSGSVVLLKKPDGSYEKIALS